MIWSAYKQGIRENLRFIRLLPWILLAICGIAVAIMWNLNAGSMKSDVAYNQVSAFMIYRVLALASVIMTGWVVNTEVEKKTIVYLLTRPIPRWMLLLARYLASVTVVFIIGLFCWLGVSIGIYGGNIFHGAETFATFEAILFGSFAYGALFLLISLLLNKSMLVSLLFAFGWEASIPNLPGTAYWFSVFTHLITIAHQGKAPAKPSNMDLLTVSLNAGKLTMLQSTVTLLGIIAVAGALALLIFTYFEYVPREDAG